MSKNNKKILMYILFLSSLVFALLAYSNLKHSQNSYLNSIVKNWSLGPISEIEASEGDCPKGKTSILNDNWEGTFSGCYCGGGLVADLKEGSCTDETGCSDVPELEPVRYKYWKGVNLCGKRSLNYLELKIAKAANACGANLKACAVIDSLGNFLCYPENQQCPYNQIIFIPEGETNHKNYFNNEVNKDKNNKEKVIVEIPLGEKGNQGKLIFSFNEKTPNANLINEFKIEDETPCMDSEQRNLSIKPYYLEKANYNKGCTSKIGDLLIDTAFQKIDSESYNKLYKENNILNPLKSLPLFNTDFDYLENKTSLWGKGFIGMNPKCIRKLVGDEPSTNVLSKLKKSYQSHFYLKNLSLIAIFITILTIFILVFLLIVNTFFIEGSQNSKLSLSSLFEICFTSLPSFVMSVVLIMNFTPITIELSPFIDPECMDRNSNIAFSQYAERIVKGNFYILLYCLSSVFGIFLNVYLILKE